MPPLYDLAWSVVFVLAPLVVVLGVSTAILHTVTARRTRRRAADAGSPLAAATILAQARATRTHVLAWGAAVVAGVALLTAGGVALGPTLAPPRFADHATGPDYWLTAWNPVPLALAPAGIALAYLAVLLAGEATWRSSDGTVRRAGLAARSAASIAPRTLRRATWLWGALLTAAALLGGFTATRTGTLQRGVAAPRAGYEGMIELVTVAPYLSWEAGVPLAAGAVALVVGVELLLRRVTDRPSIDGVDPAWDLALRHLTARRVLRLPQLVGGLAVCCVLLWLGRAFLAVGEVMIGWPLVVVGGAAGLVSLALAVVPGRPLPLAVPTAPAGRPATAPQVS